MKRQIKGLLMILVLLLVIPASGEEINSKSCDAPSGLVKVFGKKCPVYKCGHGKHPMLVIGPANLFRNQFLPDNMYEYFTIYFVDFFSETRSGEAYIKQQKNLDKSLDLDMNINALDRSKLTMDDFVEAIESIRTQIKKDWIALFGHSSNGILALKYTEKYPQYVIFNVLVGTTPFRGTEKERLSDDFFNREASDETKKLFNEDQTDIGKKGGGFLDSYRAKRAKVFFDRRFQLNETVWENIMFDEDLVKSYFRLIDDFDIRRNVKMILVPTFLALGRHDFVCPYILWENYAREILEDKIITRHVIFTKSAHYPMAEQPDEFLEELISFLPRENQV
jgi:proline iminopeptidase